MKTNDEIGQILGSRALDDTKKMRKAGADSFAKSGPEKPKQIGNKNDFILRDFPRFSRGLSQKPVNSCTNGWEPSDQTRNFQGPEPDRTRTGNEPRLVQKLDQNFSNDWEIFLR